MKLDFQVGHKSYQINLDQPLDISIPVLFNGSQPNTYDVPAATARAYQDGHFIGDTRRGGSCNFEEYKIIPHCNGTHTECVGHISHERISIQQILNATFFPATLITVEPHRASDTQDTYLPPKSEQDRLITKEALQRSFKKSASDFLQGLIIRTAPNPPEKTHQKYMQQAPPFFSTEAMQFLVETKIRHLLVDIPSVDRLFDEGKLSNHHLFWDVPQGRHDVDPKRPSLNTITEMIYVPNEVKDNNYVVNIQIPNFVADAAPSRVFLYELENTKIR